jgi:aspartate kinase
MLARANVEVLVFSSSSYRQNFCFGAVGGVVQDHRKFWNRRWRWNWRMATVPSTWIRMSGFALAVVGEGAARQPGSRRACVTAISREKINIIAIARGSSELTIAIVVRRDGLEAAVRAVCRVRDGSAVCPQPGAAG